MSVLASETQNKVVSCRVALQNVEKHLEPLLGKRLPDVSRKLAPLENAELQVGLAYTVASLYFCNLLTQGVDPSEHPIRQELDRIQLYFKKVRTTADEVREKHADSHRMRVDTEAAKRMVQHYTGAADAASQHMRTLEHGNFGASSSSSGALSHSPQTDASASEPPPQKRQKTDAAAKAMEGPATEPSETGTEARGTADEAMNAIESVMEANPKATPEPSAAKAAEPTSAAIVATPSKPPPPPLRLPPDAAVVASKPPPPLAHVAKPPIAKLPPPSAPPVAKAPVVKVPPPSLGKAPVVKAAVAKVAQLRPLANVAAAAAKTPQGPAADAILAMAKADAQRCAMKKKKKKAQKSFAAAAAAPTAVDAKASGMESPAAVEEDPYGAAVDDPYA